MTDRLSINFFVRDVLELAPDLLGKKLVRSINGEIFEYIITEVEAYRGLEDKACHASKGRTFRTEVMFMEGGHIYMYLVYGVCMKYLKNEEEARMPYNKYFLKHLQNCLNIK